MGQKLNLLIKLLSLNFTWLKISEVFLESTVIINKSFNLFFHFYQKEINRRAIVFSYVSQFFRKMFSKKKSSYMNELMYNLVTWSDCSMTLMWALYFFILFLNYSDQNFVWHFQVFWTTQISQSWKMYNKVKQVLL